MASVQSRRGLPDGGVWLGIGNTGWIDGACEGVICRMFLVRGGQEFPCRLEAGGDKAY